MTPAGASAGRSDAAGRALRHRAAPVVSVQYATSRRDLPAATTVRRYAALALMQPAQVTVRFVDRREGRALNASYRHRDYATNVLTFVYDDAHHSVRQAARILIGDIVLCVPVLREEARTQGKALIAHCAHLLVHGFLHLQGHDHQRARAALRMEALEAVLLAKLGYANPYQST